MRRFLSLITILAVSATACGGGGGDDTDEAVRVGYITPLTGGYSALGTDNELAVELAVAQVNADGGVLGRQIELITRDDQSEPDQAVLAFNDIQSQDPVAVIGSAVSDSAMATIPAVERAGVPYISPTPADEQLDPLRDEVFVVPATAAAYAERAMQYFQAEGLTEVSVAYSATTYAVAGFLATEELADEYGIDIVAVNEYQQDTTDFGHVFSEVDSVDPQALLFWGTGPPAVTFAQQYESVEADVPLVMTGAQASHLWLEPAGDAAEGVTVLSSIGVVGDHLPEGEQKQVIDEVSAAFSEEHGYAPPQFALDGYSAVQLLVAAIENAGSTEHADILAALEELTLVTPNGTYAYSDSDHAGITTEAISVNTVEDGAFVPVPWAVEQLDAAYGG
ncbi:ABC transporter substrate-binding protein [Nocardiopsis sp. NRRL B-16309]|uniref:ABC transporter substrate-binding protein n=1 Tax=Nocardiopsis sp. NRRL B-16309 TaxID=1519494 RepID=UPI0006B02504|nr:ABC transporter substrate-binding protein [Nocardiopsis sp. NRRL B-16309]